jgi:predicted kinase
MYPEAVIFIGIQATGKSTFYASRFQRTHVRINLDMLRTRRREAILLQACLDANQSFVIDNTNPTREDRARYLIPARERGFRTIGCYFRSSVSDAIRRNSGRQGDECVPELAIRGTSARLELPSLAEGFDELLYITQTGSGTFSILPWSDEI